MTLGWLVLQSTELPWVRQPAVAAIMVLFAALTLGIGWWSSRRMRGRSDFFLAGRGLGVGTMTIAAMAASLSGFSFIGGPGLVYAVGLGAVFIILPLSLTNAMSAWVLGKRLRLLAEVRPMLTIPDAIGARYRSPAAQGLAGVAIVCGVIGYTATNLLALGYVLSAVFPLGLPTAVAIGALVTMTYSVAGGIRAGVYTDLLQGSLMAAASVAVFVLVWRVGGGFGTMSTSILRTDPALLSPWGRLGPTAALSLFFVFGIGSLGQPHVVHKFYMLRDPRQLKWYPLIMAVAMSLTLLLFVGVGILMRALVARGEFPALARPDDATPLFLLHFAPTALAGLVFAGVAAAIMSTVNAFLNVGAAAITHDIPRGLGITLGATVGGARVATVALTVVSAALAASAKGLVAFLGIFGWGLFACTIVPALAVGLNWPNATRQGAIASIVTGAGLTLGLETLGYFRLATLPVNATAIALASSLLVFFAVSYATRHAAVQQTDPDIRAIMEV